MRVMNTFSAVKRTNPFIVKESIIVVFSFPFIGDTDRPMWLKLRSFHRFLVQRAVERLVSSA